MGKKLVQGEDIILKVDNKTTLHATTHTLKIDLDTKDFRTKDTDGKELYAGDISWNVDGDGLVVIDADIKNAHGPEDVLGLILSKKFVEVLICSPLTGLTKKYTGKGLITSFTLGAPAGDNATYNYSIKGSGSLKPEPNTPSK